MIELLIQLNWHVVWQAAVVMVVASAFCFVLRDRSGCDRSSHRFWIWLIACLSPVAIVSVTVSAAVLQWQFYPKLPPRRSAFVSFVSIRKRLFGLQGQEIRPER